MDEKDKPTLDSTEEPSPLIPEDLSALDAKALDRLDSDLRKDYARSRKASVPDLDHLSRIADALDSISQDRERRAQEAAEAQSKLEELDARAAKTAKPDPAPNQGDEDEETPDDGPPGVPNQPTPPGPPLEGDPPADPKVPKAKAVAASVPRITDVQVPKGSEPVKPAPKFVITAAADIPGYSPGSEMPGFREISDAMAARHRAFGGVPMLGGGEDRVKVATLSWADNYPPERVLTNDPENDWAKIQKVVGPEPIAAAAGVCAPLEIYYELYTQGSTARPVRDAMAQFQAKRGGITFVPPPNITAVTGGITRITASQQAGGSTKNVFEVQCGTPTSVNVIAQATILRFNNWNDRFYPEQRENTVKNAMVESARIAETALLDQIYAGSTQLTSPASYGAAPTMLSAVDTAVAGSRSRWRIDNNARVRAIFPDWTHSVIRSDIARRNNVRVEELSITDEEINTMIRGRGCEPTFTLDWRTGFTQNFAAGAGSAGHLRDFPDTLNWFLYPEGTWLFLDGGTLDLGVVRDSTRNAANTFDIFSEVFEAAAFVGIESLSITTSICADGTYAPAGSAISCAGS